ncbi:MAG: hypothetical protein ACR2KQ_06615 [Actinomycetota bacterium]
MDEMKRKVLGAGLMAIGVAIPLYEKVRSTAEAAGDTSPGRLVGGAMKLVEPLARPVLGWIPGLGGREDGHGSSRSEDRDDGHPPFGATTGPDRETSGSSVDTTAAPSPAKPRSTSGTPAKKTAAKKTPAKKSPAKRSTGQSAVTRGAELVSLPLPTYTHLKMPAILDALNGLTKPQLREIRDYEVANENRAPIIDRIDELLAVPLPGE